MSHITAAWCLLVFGAIGVIVGTVLHRPQQALYNWMISRIGLRSKSDRAAQFFVWFYTTNSWRWAVAISGIGLILLALPRILA